MSIIDPTKVIMTAPEYQLDQIVDLVTGSIAVGAASTDAFNVVTNATVDDIKPTLGGKIYFPKGVWSNDGGNSWNEFGNAIPLSGVDANGTRQLQVTVSCYNQTAALGGIDTTTDAVFDVFVSNGGTVGYTIIYKVLALVRPDQGKIPTPNQLPAKLNYSNKQNYMKVYKDFIQDLPTGSAPTVFTHGLGYIPNINSWVVRRENPDDGGFNAFQPNYSKGMVVNTQTITINGNSTAGNPTKAYVRVYLDK